MESARAVMNLDEICKASPLLSGLVFAAEDYAFDLSLTRTPDQKEFLYARSAIAIASRAYNLPNTIDLVCTQFRGSESQDIMRQEAEDGKSLGFNGKQCIHPSQVEIAHQVFQVSEKELEWAVRVGIADIRAAEEGRAAWALDGKMVDIPIVLKARGLLEKATHCGMDISGVQEKWKSQEPDP